MIHMDITTIAAKKLLLILDREENQGIALSDFHQELKDKFNDYVEALNEKLEAECSDVGEVE